MYLCQGVHLSSFPGAKWFLGYTVSIEQKSVCDYVNIHFILHINFGIKGFLWKNLFSKFICKHILFLMNCI